MLNFFEYIAKEEDLDLKKAKEFAYDLLNSNKHSGDCTKEPHTCLLCLLSTYIDDYYKYVKEQKVDK